MGGRKKSALMHPRKNRSFPMSPKFNLGKGRTIPLFLSKFAPISAAQVLDDDPFPGDMVNNFLGPDTSVESQNEKMKQMPKRTLFLAFLEFVYTLPGVKYRGQIIFMISILHTLYFVLTIKLTVYAVDVIGKDTEVSNARLISSDRETTGFYVGLLYLCPLRPALAGLVCMEQT